MNFDKCQSSLLSYDKSNELVMKSFRCRRCGTCCRWEGDVLLCNGDIANLAEAIGITEEKFIEEYTILAKNRRQLSLAENDDGSCIFLEEEGCRYYDARPAQCREFPYTWRVSEGCPALDEITRQELHDYGD